MAPNTTGLTGKVQDAYIAMNELLNRYGLGSLGQRMWGWLVEGIGEDAIWLELQNTPEWKTRFAGNEERRRKGLPVLSPAEYLDLESRYRQTMRAYGIPEGLFDQPDDFVRFMGADVSPTELQARLDLRAQVVTKGEMSGVLDYFRENYGIGSGDLLALWIDPDRALPVLERQVSAALVGGAARRTGFGNIAGAEALRLGDLGLTEQQATQGFGQAASLLALTRRNPGEADSGEVARDDLVNAILVGNAEAQRRVQRAQGQRVARFEGQGSFATDQTGVAGLRRAQR